MCTHCTKVIEHSALSLFIYIYCYFFVRDNKEDFVRVLVLLWFFESSQ